MPKKIGEFIINLDKEALKRNITYVAEGTVKEIRSAVRDLAFAAYSSIVSDAQHKLTDTRKDYLDGLQFTTLSPDNYLIHLEGKFPNSIEDGWGPFDMKKMLDSKANVSQGSRAGMPWVKTGKKGQRYAAVPFEHKVGAAASGASDLAGIIKNMKANNIKTGLQQKISKVYKDAEGNPLVGKVATFSYSQKDIDQGLAIPNLNNLTKYQSVYTTKNGKQRVRSVYMTFRTISDLSPQGKWYNRGYGGLKAFQSAEKYVENEIQNILNAILR